MRVVTCRENCRSRPVGVSGLIHTRNSRLYAHFGTDLIANPTARRVVALSLFRLLRLESHKQGSSQAVCRPSSRFIGRRDKGSVTAFPLFSMHITRACFRANGSTAFIENFRNQVNAVYLPVSLTYTVPHVRQCNKIQTIMVSHCSQHGCVTALTAKVETAVANCDSQIILVLFSPKIC